MTTPVTTSAPSDGTLEVAARRKRMLTGDRPTGKLHLGHYVGSVENRVRLQEEYEAFFIIADLHMLTTTNARADIDQVSANARDMVLDQLSAGIDPEKATFYLQSAIPEVSELNTLFQNLVTVPRLERVPSLKDMARDAGKDEMPYGLLGYPVLQAADILCVKGDVVPVGKDNHAHVEVTREIARRFNSLYGEVFPMPELVISEITDPGRHRRPGQDEQVAWATRSSSPTTPTRCAARCAGCTPTPTASAPTSPARSRGTRCSSTTTPSTPTATRWPTSRSATAPGRVGDVEVKEKLAAAVNTFLEPMRERRATVREPARLRRRDHRRRHRTDPRRGQGRRRRGEEGDGHHGHLQPAPPQGRAGPEAPRRVAAPRVSGGRGRPAVGCRPRRRRTRRTPLRRRLRVAAGAAVRLGLVLGVRPRPLAAGADGGPSGERVVVRVDRVGHGVQELVLGVMRRVDLLLDIVQVGYLVLRHGRLRRRVPVPRMPVGPYSAAPGAAGQRTAWAALALPARLPAERIVSCPVGCGSSSPSSSGS